MLKIVHSQPDAAAEGQRHAYNAAFEELDLSWRWDSATYSRVQAHGNDGLRRYLQDEHPHLLRAYDADFLVAAIEDAKNRCQARAAREAAIPAMFLDHSDLCTLQAA